MGIEHFGFAIFFEPTQEPQALVCWRSCFADV